MIGRAVLGGMAAMAAGGNPVQRPDQRLTGTSRSGVGPAPQNQVFIGRLAVIYGTGPSTGLFVYDGQPALGNPPILAITTASADPYGNPVTPSAITDSGMPFLLYAGSPALGNLIASMAPEAGTDEFGNVYKASVAVYGPGSDGAYVQLEPNIGGGGNTGVLVSSGNANDELAGRMFSFIGNSGDPDEYSLLQLCSAQDSAYPNFAGIGLSGSSHDGTLEPTGILFSEVSGSAVEMLTWGPSTNVQVLVPFTATDGTAASPTLVTTDTWHNITLATTWTAATPIPQYRLNADGLIELKGAVIFTSTGAGLSGNNAFTAAGAIPSAYQPASIQYFAAVLIGGSGAPTITANKTPVISLSAAGELTLLNVSSTGAAGDTVTFSFSGVAFYQVAN